MARVATRISSERYGNTFSGEAREAFVVYTTFAHTAFPENYSVIKNKNMPNLASEIELAGLFNQTILPEVSILLAALCQTTEQEFAQGKIDSSFDAMVSVKKEIYRLLEKDEKTRDKMPSPIEEDIFLPHIAAKLGKMLSMRPSFRTSGDANLLSFKIHLAATATWLVDSGSQSLPFQEKHKKIIGRSCMEGISAYLKGIGIKEESANEVAVINSIGAKINTGEINSLELADMAIMSAFVNHYKSSSDILYPAIRKIHSNYSPAGHNLIGTVLKALHSPLAAYFPISGSSTMAGSES